MPRSRLQAILLVDGYNVIGAWPALQKIRDRDGLEASREKLIEALINYSAYEDLETKIVFDAHYQDRRACTEVINQSLSVYYTEFAETADTHIEKLCASFRHEFKLAASRVIVATDDRAQRLTVVGYGAECMSAQQLVYAVESTAQRIKMQHRPKKQSSSRFLVNSLDPRSQQRLAEWRKGLR